jgi:hypothetical protein
VRAFKEQYLDTAGFSTLLASLGRLPGIVDIIVKGGAIGAATELFLGFAVPEDKDRDKQRSEVLAYFEHVGKATVWEKGLPGGVWPSGTLGTADGEEGAEDRRKEHQPPRTSSLVVESWYWHAMFANRTFGPRLLKEMDNIMELKIRARNSTAEIKFASDEARRKFTAKRRDIFHRNVRLSVRGEEGKDGKAAAVSRPPGMSPWAGDRFVTLPIPFQGNSSIKKWGRMVVLRIRTIRIVPGAAHSVEVLWMELDQLMAMKEPIAEQDSAC